MRSTVTGCCTNPWCTGSATPTSSTSPASSWTPPTSVLKKGRAHRPEPRGPGQAGLQNAHLVGRERTALPRRRLGRQRPWHRRTEAHGRGSPNETRPPPPPPLQAPSPPSRQSLRPCQPADMITGQAHRSTDRAQRHRVQLLGRRRWGIERTMSWLSGYRRLSPRCERAPCNYLAFRGVAAALCCHKRLIRFTT
ncbi:transposase [Streptomyces sp. NPDC006627]|uniref:transposase n=1 Tax=Streptomyces sp. NPDC006627 TaxID=3154679 RepID=UPI0033BB2A99